jgi:preprotein translocase subunit SecD
MQDAEVANLVAAVRQEKEIKGYTDEDVNQIESALAGKIPEGSDIVYKVIFDPVAKKVTGGTPYLLKKKAELTGDMLSDAQVQVQGNEPYVSLTFNEVGAEIFSELTGNNIGKRLAIVLDDRVSSAPVIKSKIPQGRAQITLGYGDYRSLLREAEDLTLVLREGALPATLVERTKTVIGPSLGKISIEKGVKALLIGGVLVVIFMMIYYRLSGIFATVALGVNVLLLFAILTLFQATLTLPGLAGIILTLGMAVDANIIVFERIREEVRDGKKPRVAMEAGYSNAMSAIIDANVTTFLAGVVLYQFGTGPIRGFAVTLMIGITTTLFTALVLTKAIQTWYVYGRGVDKLSI